MYISREPLRFDTRVHPTGPVPEKGNRHCLTPGQVAILVIEACKRRKSPSPPGRPHGGDQWDSNSGDLFRIVEDPSDAAERGIEHLSRGPAAAPRRLEDLQTVARKATNCSSLRLDAKPGPSEARGAFPFQPRMLACKTGL